MESILRGLNEQVGAMIRLANVLGRKNPLSNQLLSSSMQISIETEKLMDAIENMGLRSAPVRTLAASKKVVKRKRRRV